MHRTERTPSAWRIDETQRNAVNGELALSVGPTIAPYILPKFIRHYVENYPSVKLSIREDYIRQRMLNTITETLLRFMPEGMMEERIMKFGIKL